jgi:hypothetical protein
LERHEFDQAPQHGTADSQGGVSNGPAEEVSHVNFSVSKAVEQPDGHPAIVKEAVDDFLQIDQFQGHGYSTPKFRVEA